MITLKKTKALLLGLAMALVALGVLEAMPGVGRWARADIPLSEAVLAVTAGLEIISGNDRARISESTEEPAIAGIRVKDAGTQVAI